MTGKPESFATLVTLDLSGCNALTGLPSRLPLAALRTGSLHVLAVDWITRRADGADNTSNHWCGALTGLGRPVGQSDDATLPESLDQLAAPTTLDLSGCDALTGLPESLDQLATLMVCWNSAIVFLLHSRALMFLLPTRADLVGQQEVLQCMRSSVTLH